MRFPRAAHLGGLSALAIVFTTTPGLPGQTKDQSVPPPAASNGNCQKWQAASEQWDRAARKWEQELEGELAQVQEQLAENMEKARPELERLQDMRNEIESRTAEAAARAQELYAEARSHASQLFSQEPGILVRDSDEESGWLGVEIAEVTPERARDLKLPAVRGVIVQGVEADGPGSKAGLKENDVILQYDGQTVEGTVQFRRLVRETPPGRTVSLSILRNGKSQTLSVELGSSSAFFEKEMEGRMGDFGPHVIAPNFDFHFGPMEHMGLMAPRLGISAEDLSGQLGAYFGVPNGTGVLVREVQPRTPAEKAGLKAGDVILSVDGKTIRTVEDLREQLREKRDQESVNLGVLRKGAQMTLPVGIERPKPVERMHMIHRAQL